MKKHSKLLVLLLSLALIVGAIAIVASADETAGNVAEVGGVEYATLAEAIGAAENGGTVKLIADATVGATVDVAKDITIDLGGYTLNTTALVAFTTNYNYTFTISGDGEINASGAIVENTSGKPTVNIVGSFSDIKINANFNAPVFKIKSGTYNFTNVDMTATTSGNNFIDTSKDSDAVINLKVVSIKVSGLEANQNAAIIGLAGTSFLSAENSDLFGDGIVVGFNGTHTGENVLYMKDTNVTCITNVQKNGAFGAWCNLKGLMKFENCCINSSYRAFCFNCDATNSPALVDLVDTVVRMNGHTVNKEGNMFSRTIPIQMSGNSAIVSQGSVTLTYGEYNVKADEGIRVNIADFFNPEKVADNKGFIYPDGTLPSNSTTYKFIYDPIGNQEAPYLLVKVGGELDKEYSALIDKATHSWYNNFSKLYATDYNGIFYRNDDDTVDVACGGDNQVSADIWNIGSRSHWWHCFGTYQSAIVNGNQTFKYWVSPSTTGAATRNYKTAAEIPLVESFNETVAANSSNAKVVVNEIDIATDSPLGFPNIIVKPHVRKDTGGGGGDQAGSTNLTIAADGTVTPAGLDVTEFGATAKLSTTTWNRISIVIYTDPASETGYIYYFLNGNLIGSAASAYKTGGHNIFGIRLSIPKAQTVGTSVLVDNVLFAKYEGYQFGETDGDIASRRPEAYINPAKLDTSITNKAITLGTENFTNVNDAIIAGNKIGVAPKLNGNLTVPQTITTDGYIATGSYTFPTTDESYAADVKYNGKDEVIALEYNSKYGGELPVYWYIGDLNDEEQLYDDNYYYMTTVKMGETPSCDYQYPAIQECFGDYQQLVQYAFNTTMDGETPEELIPISAAIMSTAKELRYYPVYQRKSVYTWVIVDAITGEFKRGGKDTTLWNSNWNNNIKLGYGEILVACSDDFQPMGSIKLINKSTEGVTNKIWGFDVNGHNITISSLQNSNSIKQTSMFTVNAGETVLLYSSRPGGKITHLGADNTGDKVAGAGNIICFSSNRVTKVENQYSTDVLATHKVVSDPQTQSNTTVKVGAVDGKYSGNLTISGDCLVQAQSGDATSSINVEGITYVRNSFDNGFDIVRSEIYYGTIDIKNSNIFNPVGGSLVHSSGARTVTDEETGTVYNATAKVSFDNCYYLVKENGANLVNDNRGMDYVNFKNFVTNGRLNPSHKGCSFVYENVAANLLPSPVGDEKFVKAAYNVPMQLPEGMTELALTYYTYDLAKPNELTANTFKFLPYGSETTEGATALPLLTEITATVDDVVEVTFKGLGEGKDTVVKYAKGGNVQPIAIEDALFNTYKLTHDGTFSALPENVTENVTVTPGAKVEKSMNGIKANLSIYSDFNINLFIPEAIANYVTSVNADGVAIQTAAVEIDGVKYVKAIVSKASDKADETVIYEIKTSEDGNDFTFTIEISVAAYAEGILKGEAYTAEDKQLMFYMLTYANEAYKYFGNNTDNETIKALLTAYADAKGEGMAPQTYANAIAELSLGSVFESATVKLTSAPAFVLNLKAGFEGTVTVTYGENVRNYTVTATDDREIVIEGMKVYNFGAELTINATGKIGETEVKTENAKYNLDTFVKYHVESDAAESVACEALLKALYDYVTCADLYTK